MIIRILHWESVCVHVLWLGPLNYLGTTVTDKCMLITLLIFQGLFAAIGEQ